MEPLIAVAATVLPDILRHVTADHGGSDRDLVGKTVATAVQALTQESDPEAAAAKLAADPALREALRAKLGEISQSLDHAAAGTTPAHATSATTNQTAATASTTASSPAGQNEAKIAALEAKIDQLTEAHAQSLKDMQDRLDDNDISQTALQALASRWRPGSLAPPIVTFLVVGGFFYTLFFMFSANFDPNADTAKFQILNIVIGALTTAFASVISFWMGSNQSTRDKDLATASLQHLQAQQSARQTAALQQALNTRNGQAPGPTTPTRTTQTAPTTSTASRSDTTEPTLGQTAQSTKTAPSPTTTAPKAQATAPVNPTPSAADKDSAFQRCMTFVFGEEGGFVDNPDDPGGATNMGITIGTLKAWRGQAVTVDDVKNLTKDEATQIYRAQYWNPLRCDDLPLGVDMVVFDFGVNAGIRRAAETLETVLGVAVDGIIGPDTIAAAQAKSASDTVRAYSAKRLAYYQSLPEFKEFGKGWDNRVTQAENAAEAMIA